MALTWHCVEACHNAIREASKNTVPTISASSALLVRELVMRKLLIVLSFSQFGYHSVEDTGEKWASHERCIEVAIFLTMSPHFIQVWSRR